MAPTELVRIGAAVDRRLRDDLEALAELNHHSVAAEIRAALYAHVKRKAKAA